jgi:hypothetical protein
MRRISVRSRGLDRISWISWYMGVMPLPPATMPTARHWFGTYSNFLMGPFMATLSPSDRPARYLQRRGAGTTQGQGATGGLGEQPSRRSVAASDAMLFSTGRHAAPKASCGPHTLANVARGVRLDDQVEGAALAHGRRRSVRPHHGLACSGRRVARNTQRGHETPLQPALSVWPEKIRHHRRWAV